jgi:hypothetical protein
MCPLCQAARVPAFQAACRRCFRPLPPALRRDLLAAWRARVLDQLTYQETLAAVLLWSRDQRIWHQEKGNG